MSVPGSYSGVELFSYRIKYITHPGCRQRIRLKLFKNNFAIKTAHIILLSSLRPFPKSFYLPYPLPTYRLTIINITLYSSNLVGGINSANTGFNITRICQDCVGVRTRRVCTCVCWLRCRKGIMLYII